MKSIQTVVLASIVAAFSASNGHAAPHNNEHYYLAEDERELEDLIQKDQSMSMSMSYGSSYSYSYSMPGRSTTNNYANGFAKSSKYSNGSRKSAERYIALNTANKIHDFINKISGKKLPMELTFDGGGGGDNGGFLPEKYVNQCVQVNTGVSDLIMGLVDAKDADDINKALRIDFTKVVEKLKLTSSGVGGGGGSGSGFQIYLKKVQVLSVGGGGGGGCDQIINKPPNRSTSKSGKNQATCIGRGSGGGGQVIFNLPEITKVTSKSGKVRKLKYSKKIINVGGGQGNDEEGNMVFNFDEEYQPEEFIENMQQLGKLLSEADIDDIVVSGGGGGGGAGCGPNGAATIGGGYGFGYQIGTPTALEQVNNRREQPQNNCDDPLWYLSKEEKKEPWARDAQRNVQKYGCN